jgi:hypothetical protein
LRIEKQGDDATGGITPSKRSPVSGSSTETTGALCLVTGVLPGPIIDALRPAVRGLTGAPMPQQSTIAWASIVPIAESRNPWT